MIWQHALKYPVLIIGIILFSLFLMDEQTSKWWFKFSKRYIPSSCNAVKERVELKAPSNWSLECPGTELLILTVKEDKSVDGHQKLRKYLYRQMANTYVNLARFSNPETLELLLNVQVIMDHPILQINSKTDGQAVVRFLKLKTQNQIIQHLGVSVKVKETLK
jgi:hypothetical protein